MNWNLTEILQLLSRNRSGDLFQGAKHGLEREGLRIDKTGKISDQTHPKKLGSALTHPIITTDFSEAQLELVTPPLDSAKDAIGFLEEVITFVSKNIGSEYIWPFSPPSKLPTSDKKIPIGQYGTSDEGKKRTIYRRGLSLRYGRRMQTISGVHYNYSFSPKLLNLLHKKLAPDSDKQDFKSDLYFHVMRNFLRYGWLHTYLFGVSPAIHRSLLDKSSRLLKKLDWQTCYAPDATSLRISDFGYNSTVQKQIAVSYNSLGEYVEDLSNATNKIKPAYERLGLYDKQGNQVQLNTNLLQIENEYYSVVRPKQPLKKNERLTEALTTRGVEYIEVRSVDISPFHASGIDPLELTFLEIFLHYCLFADAPAIKDKAEKLEMLDNFNRTGLYGRRANLELKDRGKKISLKLWAQKLLYEMQGVAATLDKFHKTTRYTKALQKQFSKLKNPKTLPSAKFLAELQKKKQSYLQYGTSLAAKYSRSYKKKKLKKAHEKLFKDMAKESFSEQEALEIRSEFILAGYEDMELSTQVLIRAARKRGLKFDILDRKDNFLRLCNSKIVRYVKQASKTAMDTYMAFLVMENKLVTKQVLSENKIRVPEGRSYTNIEAAYEDYAHFEEMHVVVKPNSTNFGISVNFVPPGKKSLYHRALKSAFEQDNSVIVEEYLEGKEYRLLVIDDKVISVLNRVPANVIGDGKHTISELIDMKNENPYNYKIPKSYIQKGKIETEMLKRQKLTFKSIPKCGRQIFLRENSNVHSGGDPVDVTDKIPAAYKRIAVSAAHAVGARVCGVDMIIKNPKKPPRRDNHGIIELNFNPALGMHRYPYKGEGRDVGGAVLDLLGF